jgi:putative nucleotidyltransferase with HDIG domain
VLQLANSAFFGYAREVCSAPEAVQLLGVSLIRALVLGVHLFSAFDARPARAFSVDTIWRHSLRTALLARRIMELEGGDECLKEQAFTAGVLHDIGKLAFAAELPEPYLQTLKRARAQRCPLFQAELAAFGATHAELGACLLGLWGLPTPLVEAVAFHHQPATSADTAFSPLTAVHVADVLAQEKGRLSGEAAPYALDAAHLARIGAASHLPRWEQTAKEMDAGGCPLGLCASTRPAPCACCSG